ncbi:DUF2285 domain-containing protein [Novosphingobium sp. B1]|jgi:hypothetical protein|uniref:DUF2285 domain-containing protein n=1 Tax=Novosphingobium sp. B1 TaxID=1938756 RepID=UPI0009D82E33|nr:DUF2285 domain-containing protein [Novosphingobium sp. B1]SMC35206.1 hypothetical protein SAMN06272759_101709 [Novosphingobium sp. B1]
MTIEPFQDGPPGGDALTAYDLAHLDAYIHLLDVEKAADKPWRQAIVSLFGIDAAREPDRARRVYDGHLARARWMTEVGYRQLAELELHRRDSTEKS